MIAVNTDDYKKPRARTRGLLSAAAGFLGVCAMFAGYKLSTLPAVTSESEPPRAATSALWDTLATPDYLRFEAMYYREQYTESVLASQAAQAQAERAEAEAAGARTEARNYRVIASQAGADQIVSYAKGEPILLEERSRVFCSESVIGWTAEITSLESAQRGSISNLQSCEPGELAAGVAVGVAGAEQVVIRFD